MEKRNDKKRPKEKECAPQKEGTHEVTCDNSIITNGVELSSGFSSKKSGTQIAANYTSETTIVDIGMDVLDATLDWWDGLTRKPAKDKVVSKYINVFEQHVKAYNKLVNKGDTYSSKLLNVTPNTIARIVNHCENIKMIQFAKSDDDSASQLGCYVSAGEDEDIYSTSDRYIRQIIMDYYPGIGKRDLAEALTLLEDLAEDVKLCRDPNLCAVNNGIFNRETKTLEPFSPDKVFVCKIRTNYNPDAQNVFIRMPDGEMWDCESQLDSFFDEEELRVFIRKILACSVYPAANWSKAILAYSTKGCNGKGTFAKLLRSMLGDGCWISISLSEFGQHFLNPSIITSSAIIVDENDVGQRIDKAAAFKCSVTGDDFQINRKYKNQLTISWQGFIYQCVNEYPRFNDRSESLLRRLAIVPFEKSFLGCERPYIKNDYLCRKSVREYYLKTALESDVNDMEEPDVCKKIKKEYREISNPTYDFFINVVEKYEAWDEYPLDFVFEHYKAWYRETFGNNAFLGKKGFNLAIIEMLDESSVWEYRDKPHKIKQERVCKPEYAISEYRLEKYYNESYRGNSDSKTCLPTFTKTVRGTIVRKKSD